MAITVSYITPITDRTWDDIEYARIHQDDLVSKNKGAWNYTDCNRICNNLKYAADWMYEQGFLSQPYALQVKLDWTEKDIITVEQINTMIINNMNNLKSYSRDDLEWYPISSVVNMNYSLANWIEKNIHQLATQTPLPPNVFKLTVENGLGSGEYESGTTVTITANEPGLELAFDHWSGDHLENIGDASAISTTYTMPNQNINLKANYVGTVEHTMTVKTNIGTTSQYLFMGQTATVIADPAPYGKVFHHWEVIPNEYESNLYEPAATTTFTMPNEAVTLTAVYNTVGKKMLTVINGFGSGLYEYNSYALIYPNSSDSPFSGWSGDTQYLTQPTTQAYNSVLIPDELQITLQANFENQSTTEPVTNNNLIVNNGKISSTGKTSGFFQKGETVGITANASSETQVFVEWVVSSGDGILTNRNQPNTVITIGDQITTVTAQYSTPSQYYKSLTIHNLSGDVTQILAPNTQVVVEAETPPNGYTFDCWEGDTRAISSGTPNDKSIIVTIDNYDITLTAVYRLLEYHTLTVTANGKTTTQLMERDAHFTVSTPKQLPAFEFIQWDGNIDTYRPPIAGLNPSDYEFNASYSSTGTYMGTSDRTITALYRELQTHTVTIAQPSGNVSYTRLERDTLSIIADEPVAGKIFKKWIKSGTGTLSSHSLPDVTFTFGNGDALLTPTYVTAWTVTITNGYLANDLYEEGSTITIQCRKLESYEYFDGWTLSGHGSIKNIAAASTTFTVGHGDAHLTANIGRYPDVWLRIYKQDPITEMQTLVSSEQYPYGSRIENIVAPVAPNKTTFLSWISAENDIGIIEPSALSSTVEIKYLTGDTAIVATYFYPENTEEYALTIYNGYPQNQLVKVGTQLAIKADPPDQGFEFYKWCGDTAYLVDASENGLKNPDNSIIMPKQAITLQAKFKVIGELPLFRVNVQNGIASATYETGEGTEESPTVIHEERGVYIDIPAGTEVTLTADADLTGWVFDYWDGNFKVAGVNDIAIKNNPTIFTMVENDINATMIRKVVGTYTVYTTNAVGPGSTYPGRYSISGNRQDTDTIHYSFVGWKCVDIENNDCINAIEDPTALSTYITLTDKDLWITAEYIVHYKLTVMNATDTGDHYYYEGEVIHSVRADATIPDLQLVFDHWDDPMGIVVNIYSLSPMIIMQDTIATITAVYVSENKKGNSVALASIDVSTDTISEEETQLLNGVLTIGTLVFDADGGMNLITTENPDQDENTNDFRIQKFFYGG